MIKYQLSDACHGLFGDLYATEAEAAVALESVIAEYFSATAEGMEIREELDAADHYRQAREISYEEVVAEIRQFLFINEID